MSVESTSAPDAAGEMDRAKSYRELTQRATEVSAENPDQVPSRAVIDYEDAEGQAYASRINEEKIVELRGEAQAITRKMGEVDPTIGNSTLYAERHQLEDIKDKAQSERQMANTKAQTASNSYKELKDI